MAVRIDAFVGVSDEDAAVVWAVGVSIDGDAARCLNMIFEIVGFGAGLRPICVTAGGSRDAD